MNRCCRNVVNQSGVYFWVWAHYERISLPPQNIVVPNQAWSWRLVATLPLSLPQAIKIVVTYYRKLCGEQRGFFLFVVGDQLGQKVEKPLPCPIVRSDCARS